MPTLDNRHGYAIIARAFDDPEIKVQVTESFPSWRERDKPTPWINIAIKGVMTLHISPASAADLVDVVNEALGQVAEQYGWTRSDRDAEPVEEPDDIEELGEWMPAEPVPQLIA